MAGVKMEIDTNLRKQVEAILMEYGLIDDEPAMSREEAEEELFKFLEKGQKSGLSPLSHEEVFANLKARARARR